MTRKRKPRWSRSQKTKPKTAWCEKHAARVEFYPSMKELLELMKPFAAHMNLAAQDLSLRHGLESHVSLLIAARELLNQKIADEILKIMVQRRNDDLADTKILVWQVTSSARANLSRENHHADIHLADGLPAQHATVYAGVRPREVQ